MRDFNGLMIFLLMCSCFGACTKKENANNSSVAKVRFDGSSTVFPIAEALAEDYQKSHKGSRVTVGLSGTGGGFKKFCNGEVEIANASRAIRDSEKLNCGKADPPIKFVELGVAYDGIAVVVHPGNSFASALTLEQLKKIWEPGSTVTYWSDIDPKWPKTKLTLYGPGHDSGTFDYFTEFVIGETGSSRSDFTASEDDNVLVRAVSEDEGAMAYFGFAYYIQNKSRLKALAIGKTVESAMVPTIEIIRNKSYVLARPLFMYVNATALQEEGVQSLLKYFFRKADELVSSAGYVPFAPSDYVLSKAKLKTL